MNFKLDVSKREKGTKGDLTSLRNSGRIPAVIYGQGKPAVSISMDKLEFARAYRKAVTELAFFDLVVEGRTLRTIIRDRQIHPVSRDIIHVDFLELHENKPIHLEIPVHFTGTPAGVENGGRLEELIHKIEISCLPKDVPDHIMADVKGLEIGQSLHVGDLKIENAQVITGADLAIAVVHAPKKDSSAAAAAPAEA